MSKITFPGGNSAGGGGVTDHGGLAGLGDDDHTQYLLRSDFAASGSPVDGRAVSGNIIVDTNEAYDLGSSGSKWNNVYTASGVMASGFNAGSGQVTGELVVGTAANSVRINEGIRSIEFYEGAIKRATLWDGGLDWKTSSNITWGTDTRLTRNGVNSLLLDNGGGVSGTFTGGSGVFAKQVTISGVNVGDYLGAGGGNPVDARAVTGNIIPDTNYAYDLGNDGSGYRNVFLDDSSYIFFGVSGSSTNVLLKKQTGVQQLECWNTKVNDFANIKGKNVYGSNLVSADNILKAGQYINVANKIALKSTTSHILDVFNLAGTESGIIRAASGVFYDAIRLDAPNGSGWLITVDNSGILTTSGPIV